MPLAVVFAGIGLVEKGNPAFALVAFVFAYPVGFIPSIVAGLLYILMSPYLLLRCSKYPKICACIIGVFCSLIAAILLIYCLFQDQKGGIDSFSTMLILASLLAGGVCGILSMRLKSSSTSILAQSDTTFFRWLLAMGVVIVFFALISIASD